MDLAPSISSVMRPARPGNGRIAWRTDLPSSEC